MSVAAVHPFPASDRRDSARVNLDLGAILTFQDGVARWTEADAEIADLSRVGLLLRCDRRPRGHETILLRMDVPGRGLCAAAGRPARVAVGGFAIAFDEVNAPLDALIRTVTALTPGERAHAFAGVTEIHVLVDYAAAAAARRERLRSQR